MATSPHEWLFLHESRVAEEAYELPDQSRLAYVCQRIVEIAVALVFLVLTLPVMLAVGFIIRRGTGGPVLFWQFRVGRDERPFLFVKFRTLYADARKRWPELYAYNYTDTRHLVFKITNDPRVTTEGVWLRKSTLDELPNFWNVLTGDMALVGPRPEIPQMMRYYRGEHRLKFRVRPGITGLAQISGRGRLGFLETADLDVHYARNRSLGMDCKILLLTLYKIVTRDGAF